MADDEDTRPEPGRDVEDDELQADIEKTRDELGQTIKALSHEVDVKARAHEKMDQSKAALSEGAHDLNEKARSHPGPIVAALAGAVVVVGIVVWLRRR